MYPAALMRISGCEIILVGPQRGMGRLIFNLSLPIKVVDDYFLGLVCTKALAAAVLAALL